MFFLSAACLAACVDNPVASVEEALPQQCERPWHELSKSTLREKLKTYGYPIAAAEVLADLFKQARLEAETWLFRYTVHLNPAEEECWLSGHSATDGTVRDIYTRRRLFQRHRELLTSELVDKKGQQLPGLFFGNNLTLLQTERARYVQQEGIEPTLAAVSLEDILVTQATVVLDARVQGVQLLDDDLSWQVRIYPDAADLGFNDIFYVTIPTGYSVPCTVIGARSVRRQ